MLFLTGAPDARLAPADVAHGGAWFPAIGFAFGAATAAVLLAAERIGTPSLGLAVLGVALLWLASGGSQGVAAARAARAIGLAARDRERGLAALEERSAGSLGTAIVAVMLGAKAAALASLAGGTLALAVVLTATLARWALVVQAYGSLSARPEGLGATLAREMKFREFGLASVTAMAATLALSNALGVVLLIGVGTASVALRILVHRSFGGVTPVTIRAGGELAETVALVLSAALVALIRSLRV